MSRTDATDTAPAAAGKPATRGEIVEAFTDGACLGNPGPGGWGAVLRCGDQETELSGGEADTTNNRMELLAAIQALESLPEDARVRVTTDSNYLRQGITSWIHGWKRKGWKTAGNKPVKNQDLWRRLDAALQRHAAVEWAWVRGHTGHADNERADRLATAEAARWRRA